MDISTAGVIGALIGMVLAVIGYIPRRDYFRQQLAQFNPADGEKQRELLRWGLKRSERWWESSWARLPGGIIAGAIAGYLIGRLFD